MVNLEVAYTQAASAIATVLQVIECIMNEKAEIQQINISLIGDVRL